MPVVLAAETPVLEENILYVPWEFQHKDTNMLCLEGCRIDGPSAWDLIHTYHYIHGNNYCGRAVTAMIVNWYLDRAGRGDEKLSQDRISFKDGWDTTIYPVDYAFKHGGTGTHELDWALGTSTQWHVNASFAQIKDWIDKQQPFAAAWSGHYRVIDGYRSDASGMYVHVQDPWPLTEPEEPDKWIPYSSIPSGWAASVPPSPEDLEPGMIKSDEDEVWTDTDGDGIVDFDEIQRFKTDLNNPDTDGDGIWDKIEIQSYLHNWDWYIQTINALREEYPSVGWLDSGDYGHHITAHMNVDLTPIFWSTVWYWWNFDGAHPEASPSNMVRGPWHPNEPLLKKVAERADFDNDGLRAEVDPDNDQDGISDGQEDRNYNGIFEPELGETSIFNPDTVAPTTHIEFGEPSYLDTSYSPSRQFITPVTQIQLIASDSGPVGYKGVSARYYRYYQLSGTTTDWIQYTGAFKIRGPDGRYFIEYYSTDLAGNREHAKQEMVFLISSFDSPFQLSKTQNTLEIYFSDFGYTAVNFQLKGINSSMVLAQFSGVLSNTKWTASLDLSSYTLSGWYRLVADTGSAEFPFIFSLNQPPSANAGGPYIAIEGTVITFDASGSTDANGDLLEYRWDFESDGIWDTTWSSSPTASFTWNDDYTGWATLKVTDGEFSDTATAAVTVNNVSPVILVSALTIVEGQPLIFNEPLFYDPAGRNDFYSVTWDYGDDRSPSGFSDDPDDLLPQHIYTNSGIYQATLTVTDEDGGIVRATVMVTVLNTAPEVNIGGDASLDEGNIFSRIGSFTDPGADIWTATVDFGDGTGTQSLALNEDKTFNLSYVYADNGVFKLTVTVTESGPELASGTDIVTVTVNNVAPTLDCEPEDQYVQYSDGIDSIEIIATDVTADILIANTQWRKAGDGFISGLFSGLSLNVGSVTDNEDGTSTSTWTIDGIASVTTGIYTIRITVSDEDGGSSFIDFTVNVTHEDAMVTFLETNPAAVKVDTESGTNSEFYLTVILKESYNGTVEPNGEPNTNPGNIDLAQATASLIPIGPGGSISSAGAPVYATIGTGYFGYRTATFTFSDVPVNTYMIQVNVAGEYYTGSSEDVLTVYDPSLGFTSGGGWFYWPGTTEKTNFGYTMKYNKKGSNIQGSLLLIRHLSDGSIYRIKSNALEGLAIGEDISVPMGWASFSGKCTYFEPGWQEPVGNYNFTVYVEDRNEPGIDLDKFWINIIGGLSIGGTGITNSVPIEGGNIIIPHSVPSPKK
jgi:hypothetical protein